MLLDNSNDVRKQAVDETACFYVCSYRKNSIDTE